MTEEWLKKSSLQVQQTGNRFIFQKHYEDIFQKQHIFGVRTRSEALSLRQEAVETKTHKNRSQDKSLQTKTKSLDSIIGYKPQHLGVWVVLAIFAISVALPTP